jgi:lipopolysaccharide biosynthesis glycosyltransferase
MNVAFCNNRLGLIGLGSAVTSLIRNCTNSRKLKIWFFCAGHTNKDKNQIEELLFLEGFQGEHRIIDFDPYATFGTYCSLHGDWTCYGRLLLADFIDEDQVLYLDSDLIVEEDVLTVENFDFQGTILAAVGGGKFRYTLGHKFYINQIGIDPDLEYFNDGVMLLNLREWRLRNVKQKCLQIANLYPLDLPSHDQSLLNITCMGNFAKLPSSFNCEWGPGGTKPSVSGNMILHFIGSPKPWDPLAFLIHRGYDSWAAYQQSSWTKRLVKMRAADLKRAWNIRRSYIRYFRNKLLN